MDSWLLKLNRAEEHLAELKFLIGPNAGVRQAHPVTERFETYHGEREWVYRLDLGMPVVDERLAIVAGDFLFNVRSALDHRAVSLVPSDHKHHAGFPIFSDDALVLDPAGKPGSHLNSEAWRAWKKATRGFPQPTLTALIDLQPFKRAKQHTQPADRHALEILRVLHDADEHQELFVADRGVEQVNVLVNGVINHSPPSLVKDGAVVYSSPAKVKAEVIGAALVGLGVGAEGRDEWRWPLPRTFETILNNIVNEVLPALAGLTMFPR
jgi:hypothetical protein